MNAMIIAGGTLANASMATMAGFAVVATVGAYVDQEWYAEKRTAIMNIVGCLLVAWLVWGGFVTYRVLMVVNVDLTLHPDQPLSSLGTLLDSQASTWSSLRPLILVGLVVLVYLGLLERMRATSTKKRVPDWVRISRRVGHMAFDGLLGWIVGGTGSTLGILRDGVSYTPSRPIHELDWLVTESVHTWHALFPVAVGIGVVLVLLHTVVRVEAPLEPEPAAA